MMDVFLYFWRSSTIKHQYACSGRANNTAEGAEVTVRLGVSR